MRRHLSPQNKGKWNPQIFILKGPKLSALLNLVVESNEIETDATRIVRSQNFVESALFVKDEKIPAMSRLISNV
jgi:hypothetical protein